MVIDRLLGRFRWGAILLLLVTGLLFGQGTSPVVDQPYAGDRNVTGQGVPASAPLTVYDASSNSRSYLGSGKSIDRQGYFAIAVDPPLSLGQKIVVVDSQRRSSVAVVVVTKPGPAGPSN